jgi:hypothetical protein
MRVQNAIQNAIQITAIHGHIPNNTAIEISNPAYFKTIG